jgi:SAM-dependent MidA family methyltransferase
MSEWLYGERGYYAGVGQVGKAGDFLTSPSVSMFFGGAIASKFVSLVRSGVLPRDSIVCEFGANSLYALKDFASFIAGLEPELLRTLKFVVVEKQAKAADFQNKELKEFFADVDFEIVNELKGFEDRAAFVFANEIFDAFACELIHDGKFASVREHKISFDIGDEVLLKKAQKLEIAKGEIALGYEEFAKELYDAFAKSYFVTFDYGQEYARNDFSVRIYKEHKSEPLFGVENLGEYFASSDITYDVNFGHLARAFEDAGFDTMDYKNQASALVNFGISELLEMYLQKAGEAAYLKEAAKAKALLAPEGFGERFKMISFGKGIV